MSRRQRNSVNFNDPFQVLGLEIDEKATHITAAQLAQARKKYLTSLAVKKGYKPSYSSVDAAYDAFKEVYGRGNRVLDVSKNCSLQRDKVVQAFQAKNSNSGKRQEPLLTSSSADVSEQKLSIEEELRAQIAQLKAEIERLKAQQSSPKTDTEVKKAIEAELRDLQLTEENLRRIALDSGDESDNSLRSSTSAATVDAFSDTSAERRSVSSYDDEFFNGDFDPDADNDVPHSSFKSEVPQIPNASIKSFAVPVPHVDSPWLEPLYQLKAALEGLKQQISVADGSLLPNKVGLLQAVDQELEFIKFRIKGHHGWDYDAADIRENNLTEKHILAFPSEGGGVNGLCDVKKRLENVLDRVDDAIKGNSISGISKAGAVVKAILANIATLGLINVTQSGRSWVASFFKPHSAVARDRANSVFREKLDNVKAAVTKVARVSI